MGRHLFFQLSLREIINAEDMFNETYKARELALDKCAPQGMSLPHLLFFNSRVDLHKCELFLAAPSNVYFERLRAFLFSQIYIQWREVGKGASSFECYSSPCLSDASVMPEDK